MLKCDGTNMCDRYSVKSHRKCCKIVDIAMFLFGSLCRK